MTTSYSFALRILNIIYDLEKQVQGDVESNIEPVYKIIEHLTHLSHPTSQEFKQFEKYKKDILSRCDNMEVLIKRLRKVLEKSKKLE